MLSEHQTSYGRRSEDRRAQSHDLIKELVTVRTEMLSLYGELAAKRPFESEEESLPEILQEFCQILIDYTASAHFRLYRFIEEKMEKRKHVLKTAESAYPRISAITECIVKFNDRYEMLDNGLDLPQLEKDLSRLGEFLAERIELEDAIIEALVASRGMDRKTETLLHS